VTHCPQACALCDSVRRGCIGFTPAFMGALRAVGHVGYLGGVVLYNARYKATDFRTIFAWAWLVQGLSIVPDLLLVTRANVALGLPDHAFMLGDQILHQMLGQLKHLPFLVLAARICPPHVEATLFATIMSISNFDAVDEFQKTMGLRAQAGGLEEGMAVGGDGSGGGGGGRASTPTTPTRSAPSR